MRCDRSRSRPAAASRRRRRPRTGAARRPDVTIHNTTAVLGAGRGARRKVPDGPRVARAGSLKHRGLAAVHRAGLLAAVVGSPPTCSRSGAAASAGRAVQAAGPQLAGGREDPRRADVGPGGARASCSSAASTTGRARTSWPTPTRRRSPARRGRTAVADVRRRAARHGLRGGCGAPGRTRRDGAGPSCRSPTTRRPTWTAPPCWSSRRCIPSPSDGDRRGARSRLPCPRVSGRRRDRSRRAVFGRAVRRSEERRRSGLGAATMADLDWSDAQPAATWDGTLAPCARILPGAARRRWAEVLRRIGTTTEGRT